jgi:hypothetical protein
MRGAWSKGLQKLGLGDDAVKKYTTVEGAFDDFSKSGVEKGTVDLVVIAQAWHWCPDYDAALVCGVLLIGPLASLLSNPPLPPFDFALDLELRRFFSALPYSICSHNAPPTPVYMVIPCRYPH